MSESITNDVQASRKQEDAICHTIGLLQGLKQIGLAGGEVSKTLDMLYEAFPKQAHLRRIDPS